MPSRANESPRQLNQIESSTGPSASREQGPPGTTTATEVATTQLLVSDIPERLLRSQMDRPVRVQVHFAPRPGAPPIELPFGSEKAEKSLPPPLPVSSDDIAEPTLRYDRSRDPPTASTLTADLDTLLQVETSSVEQIVRFGRGTFLEGVTSDMGERSFIRELDSPFQTFFSERLSRPAMEAAMDGAATTPDTSGSPSHLENKLGGMLFTLLHCLSQAITNIFTQNVVECPMAKIAFYTSFGVMIGSMPQAFKLTSCLASSNVNVQFQLLLRTLSSLMALILKVQALRFITVSDLSIVYSMVPVGVMVVSWYFLDEQMRVPHWIAVLLCATGVVVVMRPETLFKEVEGHAHRERVKGVLFAFGSALSLIALVITIRSMRNLAGQFLSFNSGLTRSAVSLVMAISTRSFGNLLSGRYLGALLILGKINFCAVGFLNNALVHQPAATVTVTKFCGDVVCSIIIQTVFTKVYPDWYVAVGTGFVLASCFVIAGENAISSWVQRVTRVLKNT